MLNIVIHRPKTSPANVRVTAIRSEDQTIPAPRIVERPDNRPQVRYRLTLAGAETFTLASGPCDLCVLSGSASIMFDEQAFALHSGESRAIMAGHGGLTIAASAETTLVFDIALDAESAEHLALKQRFYERMAARQHIMDAESHHSG
ncbi:MAG: hypothetical protein KC519_10870 [Anaerolineae bacterium]|nr:hypothetical protein [Anaerolineae bacterium]